MSLDPEPSPLSDEELMRLTAGGDEPAFTLLIQRHQSLVRGTLFRMLADSDEVDDLAQQVYLRVWKAAPRYRPEAKFTTWLLTILRNLVFNESRRRRFPLLKAFAGDSEHPLPEASTLPSAQPDQQEDLRELQLAIQQALLSLPPKQRLALVLHRFEGQPHEEVARVLRTSVPSTKSLIFRARETLRHELRRWLPD